MSGLRGGAPCCRSAALELVCAGVGIERVCQRWDRTYGSVEGSNVCAGGGDRTCGSVEGSNVCAGGGDRTCGRA
jgi:hypothetical protein